MLLWSLLVFLIFLANQIHRAQSESLELKEIRPQKFILNGVSYQEAFKPNPLQEDMRFIRILSNELHLTIEPAMPLVGKIFFSKKPVLSSVIVDKLNLDEEWQMFPLPNLNCIQSPSQTNAQDCLQLKLNLAPFFSDKNEVLLSFHWTDTNPTTKDTFLVLTAYQFVFNMEPMIPPNIFAPSNNLLVYIFINEQQLNLKSTVSSEREEKVQLFSLNQGKARFDLLFRYGIKDFECEGNLTPDTLQPGQVEYSWKVYRPSLPLYSLFRTTNTTFSLDRSAVEYSFLVNFTGYEWELLQQNLRFDLVCNDGSSITLNTFQLDKHSPDSLYTPKNDDFSLPFFYSVKTSELVSPIVLKRYEKVKNVEDPSLPSMVSSKDITYYPPISMQHVETSQELFRDYANIGSSFVMDVYVFDNEIPIDILDSQGVKGAEINWMLKFDSHKIIPYALRFRGTSDYSVQVQAVVWPEDGNFFQTPISTFFKPISFTGTPLESNFTILKDELNIEEQFKDFFILKDILEHKVELRFYASNVTHFTTWRIYLNPLQSSFTPPTEPSFYAREALDEIKLQGKVVEAFQLQSSCYRAKIIDLILEESVIDFSFRFKDAEDITEMELWIDGKNIDLQLYGRFLLLKSADTYKLYLDQELFKVTYLDELHYQIINLQPYIPQGQFYEHGSQCIQARLHVPSYIYKLPLHTLKDINEILTTIQGDSTAHALPNRKLLNLIESTYIEAAPVLWAKKISVVYDRDFFSSYFVEAKEQFERMFFGAIQSASYVLLLTGLSAFELNLHYKKVLNALLDPKKPQIISTRYKEDTFPFYLSQMCDLFSKYPKFLSLYVRSMPSPRFQSLFPNRVYTDEEIGKAQIISNMFTLCNYRKWVHEASGAKTQGKRVAHYLRGYEI